MFLANLPGAGRQFNAPIVLLNVFLETTLSPRSLELLIGLLAYLEPQLWPNKQKSVKLSTPTNANPAYITSMLYMAITRQQLEQKSCSNQTLCR